MPDTDVGCAGQYTCKEGRNSPCLVYVSFNHKIYIYWKVELERMESTNLLRLLEEKPEFRRLVKELRVGRCTRNSVGGRRGGRVAASVSHGHLLCLCLNWTSEQP